MNVETLPKPTLLLTGAGGVIGPQIVPYLRQHYHLVLTDLNEGVIDGIPVRALDITDFEQTLEAMQGVDYVVHMAIASVRKMGHLAKHEADDLTMRVNVLGTQHVFEAARQQGVKRVAFFSSMTVFLGEPSLEHVDEDTPVQPINLYACTKLFGEHLADLYWRRHALPVVCLRVGQPIPIEGHLSYERLKEWPSLCAIAVAYEDIAAAVIGALDPHSPPFALVNVFSASDQKRFEHTGADSIGFTPSVYFTADGPAPVPAGLLQKEA